MAAAPSNVYYGACTPYNNSDPNDDGLNIFADELDALKVAEENGYRFKALHQYHHEPLGSALSVYRHRSNFRSGPVSLFNGTIRIVRQKACPSFKEPKFSDLLALRAAIEEDHLTYVKEKIWQNPRLLISSGGTLTKLQDQPRCNALQVAAKSNSPRITHLILSTISNSEFIKLRYRECAPQNPENLKRILLDLYLNTPDNEENNTPLHSASQYGSARVVEILISYPQCDKTMRNKYNELAEEIICERAEGINVAAVRREIELLLKGGFYVPVLRSGDNSTAPIIGEPFSPSHPLVLNSNPLNPRMEIHAYAGPMHREIAHEFRRVWKTPRHLLKANSSIDASLRFKDLRKGLERIGKRLSSDYAVSWREYWPFLGDFVDFATKEGLASLERYLAERYRTHSELQYRFPGSTIGEASRISCSYPVTYLSKACQTFVRRTSIAKFDVGILQTIQAEVKEFETLNRNTQCTLSSYYLIDLEALGMRIAGKLIGTCLDEEERASVCQGLQDIVDVVTKNIDCFCSNEVSENCKPTIYKKQLTFLFHYVINIILSRRQKYAKKSNAIESSTSTVNRRRLKRKGRILKQQSGVENVDRVGYGNSPDVPDDFNYSINKFYTLPTSPSTSKARTLPKSYNQGSSSDDDKFYSTPTRLRKFDYKLNVDDEFRETDKQPKHNIFLERDFPTKLDCEVFNALYDAKVQLNSKNYPHVYEWRHAVSLYSSKERERWPVRYEVKSKRKQHVKHSRKASPPYKSWLQITGVNSPKAIMKSLED